MTTHAEIIKIKTKTNHFYDLTEHVKQIVKNAEITEGLCSIFCPGTTATILLNENNPMVLADVKNLVQKLIPEEKIYQHPDNGASHLKAMLIGSNNHTIPVENGEIVTGEWQNVIFFELDVMDREREIFITVIGE